MPLNIEIKAHCTFPEKVINKLVELGAEYKGRDHQIDTYFQVPNGRLKLREGKIENNLIQYDRPDQAGPKGSQFKLYPITDGPAMKALLSSANGIKTIVDKQRHIYYIENVKFHVDEVKGLGSFVEIEAGDLLKPLSAAELHEQCDYYLKVLNISPADLVEHSYSDLMLQKSV